MSYKNIIMSVTTFNRVKYLKTFIDTWEFTRSPELNWTLLVANDGSSDSTLDFLGQKLKEPLSYTLKVINNNRKGVHYQTNTIFDQSLKLNFDFGFKADDDIIFLKKGWDHKYIDSSIKNGYDHLVYYNTKWKPKKIEHKKDDLCAFTDPMNCLGCFWTYTPKMLKKIGYFDYASFGLRGNGHIDYTIRACRAGFNDREKLFDILNSNSFISMQPREGYIETINHRDMAKIINPAEQARRKKIIMDEKRLYIPLNNK